MYVCKSKDKVCTQVFWAFLSFHEASSDKECNYSPLDGMPVYHKVTP